MRKIGKSGSTTGAGKTSLHSLAPIFNKNLIIHMVLSTNFGTINFKRPMASHHKKGEEEIKNGKI
ncbi:hypothetical protein ADU37_CDS22220 [Thermococcus sp. 2319x1]|uniref:hypothetical protein n=1 Tax=Thermococcus sp. 2319x1 TaxID=1674923 RepID=UPI00073AA1B4|nr:hypothetical protein [Thermococcus sp. 2319x1]ALV63919.1 hypothetical protein ADU37_CDS22220 [Thermococcus sp. 2319x1]